MRIYCKCSGVVVVFWFLVFFFTLILLFVHLRFRMLLRGEKKLKLSSIFLLTVH